MAFGIVAENSRVCLLCFGGSLSTILVMAGRNPARQKITQDKRREGKRREDKDKDKDKTREEKRREDKTAIREWQPHHTMWKVDEEKSSSVMEARSC
jgi:hypothetical protein